MTELALWLAVGAIFVLLFLSGFFSGSETALTAASRARMHQLEKKGDWRARIESVPLGPGLGQCCGGHVWLWFAPHRNEDLPDDARLRVETTGETSARLLATRQESEGLPLPVAHAATAMLSGWPPRSQRATSLREPRSSATNAPPGSV